MKKLVAVMAIALSGGSVNAAFFTGSDLMSMLNAGSRVDAGRHTDRDVDRALEGLAYLQGVVDAMSGVEAICLPQGFKGKQLLAMAKQNLERNPSRWNEPAAVLMGHMLVTAFPCK